MLALRQASGWAVGEAGHAQAHQPGWLGHMEQGENGEVSPDSGSSPSRWAPNVPMGLWEYLLYPHMGRKVVQLLIPGFLASEGRNWLNLGLWISTSHIMPTTEPLDLW